MRWLSQTFAVIALGIRTIPRRLSSSVVAIVGVAGVVVVLVSVLSISEGFKAAVAGTGSPSRAIVLRQGSDNEMTSGITGPEADIVREAPGMAREGQADSQPGAHVAVRLRRLGEESRSDPC